MSGVVQTNPMLIPYRNVMLTFIAVLAVLWGAVIGVAEASTKLDWSEEVKLHDGRVIVIKRHQELGSSGFPVQRRGFMKYHHFCYAPMGIQWKSSGEYFPETFDIVNGKGYAKVTVTSCITCAYYGYPEDNALYFTWDGSQWKRISLAEYPKGLKYNLLNNTHGDRDTSRDARGLVTVVDKEWRDASIYRVMAARGNAGLNDTLTTQDACRKCKDAGRETARPSEIFLPTRTKDCQ